MHNPLPRWITVALSVVASCSLGSLMLSEVSVAQIRPDSSLPQNSTVRSVGSQRLIENGTTAGTNLFHSFESFSVPEGITASFENATAIRNIFTRITGPNQSRVFGTLKSVHFPLEDSLVFAGVAPPMPTAQSTSQPKCRAVLDVFEAFLSTENPQVRIT